MIILATAELYGGKLHRAIITDDDLAAYSNQTTGFMTFCPEWLTGNINLDSSNFMYLWVYLVFFNCLWVVIPFYAMWYAYCEISNAFAAQTAKKDK